MDLRRDVDPVLLAAFAKSTIYPVVLVYIDWPVNVVRVHSGTGAITWDGDEWAGVGKLGSIEVPQEVGGIVPESARLTIVGPISDVLDEASEQLARGRQVDIWVGATTTPGGTVLEGGPLRVFTGSVGSSEFTLDAGRSFPTLVVDVISGQPARASAQIVHSHEDQNAKYPGDTFFRRVAHAAKWRSNPPQWPAA